MQAALNIILFVFILSSSDSTPMVCFYSGKNVPDHEAMNCGEFVF